MEKSGRDESERRKKSRGRVETTRSIEEKKREKQGKSNNREKMF